MRREIFFHVGAGQDVAGEAMGEVVTVIVCDLEICEGTGGNAVPITDACSGGGFVAGTAETVGCGPDGGGGQVLVVEGPVPIW